MNIILKRLFSSLLLPAVFLLLSADAFSRSETILQTRIQLQQHLSQSLQDYDPKGRVVVYVDEEGGELLPPLPGLAQTQNLQGRSSVGRAQKKFTAHVFTELESLPEDLEAEIQSYLSHSGAKAEIAMFPVSVRPSSRAPASANQDEAQEVAGDSGAAEESSELASSSGTDIGADSASSFQNSFEAMASRLGNWAWALIAVAAGMGFLLWWGMRGIQQQLASRPQTEATPQPSAPRREPARREMSTNDAPSWQGARSSERLKLSDETMVALLSDCYWCGEDAYAHWLWQSLSSDQQARLLEQWSACKAYSEHFFWQAPEEKSFHKDAFYLQAPDWKHLSMKEAAGFLKKSAVFWKGLSPMRKQSLSLGLAERSRIVETAKQSSFSAEQEESLAHSSPSEPRTFTERMHVASMSAKLEEEILAADKKLQRKWVQELPASLVWLSIAGADEREQALREFSAEEIAEAWTGADKVLRVLQGSMPDSKWQLVQDYLEQLSPSRASESYKALAEVGAELFLKSQEPATPEKLKAA